MRQNKIITRFSILLGVLFFWGNSFAQISLSINQQTIKQIIPQIEKTSGYNVFYTDKLPNLDTRKDLLVSNAPLEATLKELFKGTKITFEIKLLNYTSSFCTNAVNVLNIIFASSQKENV